MSNIELAEWPRPLASEVGDRLTSLGQLPLVSGITAVRAKTLERAVGLVRHQPRADSSWVRSELMNFGGVLFGEERLEAITRKLIADEAEKIGLQQARIALAFTNGGNLGQEARPIPDREFLYLLDFAKARKVIKEDSQELLVARELLIPGWANLIPPDEKGNKAFINFCKRARGQLAGVQNPVFSLPPSVPGRLLACAAAHWGVGDAVVEHSLFRKLIPFFRKETQKYALLAGIFSAAMPEALSFDKLAMLIRGFDPANELKMITLLGPEYDFYPAAMAYWLVIWEQLCRVEGRIKGDEKRRYLTRAKATVWPGYRERLSDLFPQLTDKHFETILAKAESFSA